MKRTVCLCDLCLSDGEVVLAAGRYITPEKQTYHACDEHLEECKGYGFVTVDFKRPGDIEIE
ncbi:MAG: hypothetical protein K9N47_21025 [Prosthecobacter sp.]|uniref:hypothetical protein n=1 Tax=Prosthecobacter sp. TaxID=1965333 RepID=UPI002617E652|nr:hypothetical protein [Prosthecobacter sp.]MCF7788619.1 hypothetical protein [Prosthecobacter sp.]